LAQAAVEFFHGLDGETLPPELLGKIAKEIQAQMTGLCQSFSGGTCTLIFPLILLPHLIVLGDSKAARAWALRAVELVGSVKSARAQQQLLDVVLPQQQVLLSLLEEFRKSPSQALVTQSECVQACVFELLVLVGPAVLFCGKVFGNSQVKRIIFVCLVVSFSLSVAFVYLRVSTYLSLTS